jgi:hypothetical protein
VHFRKNLYLIISTGTRHNTDLFVWVADAAGAGNHTKLGDRARRPSRTAPHRL